MINNDNNSCVVSRVGGAAPVSENKSPNNLKRNIVPNLSKVTWAAAVRR
jgi:hypothetical protein